MLLVDKVANRVVRRTLEEAQTALALPVALSRHFACPVQIYVSFMWPHLVMPVIH